MMKILLTASFRGSATGVLAMAMLSSVSRGDPPVSPIPAPHYSFDLNSPSVIEGDVSANAILQIGYFRALEVTSGAVLGLAAAGDDLDALSGANSQIAANDSFALLFSVDRVTLGAVAPVEELVDAGVGYNVLDQAARGQQAGDQFMSLALFTRSEILQSNQENNVLVRNNYDEGGTDFGALPMVSAAEMAVGMAQDHVDAMGYLNSAGVYYSTTAGSPSLSSMDCVEEPSGAHILFCLPGMPQPTLYASCDQLGLVEQDDVDALIVFDGDSDGAFNGADVMLFSLTPESPSLGSISGASDSCPAADVFVVVPGGPPSLFASGELLGLGAGLDDVDALELLLCTDAQQCAELHGIRSAIPNEDQDGDGGEANDEPEPDVDDPEAGPTDLMKSYRADFQSAEVAL